LHDEGNIDVYDENFLNVEEAFDQGIRLICSRPAEGSIEETAPMPGVRGPHWKWGYYEAHTIS
jgi:hypothetical protein